MPTARLMQGKGPLVSGGIMEPLICFVVVGFITTVFVLAIVGLWFVDAVAFACVSLFMVLSCKRHPMPWYRFVRGCSKVLWNEFVYRGFGLGRGVSRITMNGWEYSPPFKIKKLRRAV